MPFQKVTYRFRNDLNRITVAKCSIASRPAHTAKMLSLANLKINLSKLCIKSF